MFDPCVGAMSDPCVEAMSDPCVGAVSDGEQLQLHNSVSPGLFLAIKLRGLQAAPHKTVLLPVLHSNHNGGFIHCTSPRLGSRRMYNGSILNVVV